MPEYIGGENGILIPEITPTEVFPLQPLWGSGQALEPKVATHPFRSANVKIEQRFLLGNGAKRFRVIAELTSDERTLFRSFWETIFGAYGSFYYDAPNEDQTTTRYVCRFADASIGYEYTVQELTTVGVELVEVPASSPEYSLTDTLARFPDSALETALLDQVQILVPLLKITVTDALLDPIYLSDRRVTIGGQLYQPRILSWDGISQSLNGPADQAQFTLGNADRVISQLSNITDLWLSSLEFSLFHVGTGVKIDLWKGYLWDWNFQVDSQEFSISGIDGLYALTLGYPRRKVSRTCWKLFDSISCPYTAVVGGPETSCDKSFSNCQARSMDNYFGGLVVTPKKTRNKDNSTGTFGYGRSTLTSVSLVGDSIYSEAVPEYYVRNWTYPLKVNAKLVTGQDEGDYYIALGIVGEGPIGAYGYGHLLDGQSNHGPGTYGLRESLGEDPNLDPFALGSGGEGLQTYGEERAAGTAFVEIRRKDTKGLQLSSLAEHSMQCLIAQGCKGWTWDAPGSRSATQTSLHNPIWVCVNVLLRALQIEEADSATQEAFFDTQSAIDAAAICELSVDSLCERRTIETETPPILPEYGPDDGGVEEPAASDEIPSVLSETQFKFCGGMVEQKPVRDWIVEILNNCLGYFVMRAGKVAFGIRVNSSATEAFTEGNIILGSLQLSPRRPQFNGLTVNFADEEYGYVNNSVRFYDADHVARIGMALSSELNLAGTSSKSQAMRVAISRLREEVGGSTLAEQAACRDVAFRTTVLALKAEPGVVGSITHDDMPSAIHSYGYGEFRIQEWKLRQDFSIDVSGRGAYDSMFDYVNGPKPADVAASPLPSDPTLAPADWSFSVSTDRDGHLQIRNLTCKTNGGAVDHAVFEVYYIPEPEHWYTSSGDLTADLNDTSLYYSAEPPVPGEWVLLKTEVMFVESVVPGTGSQGIATVRRGSNVWDDEDNALVSNAYIPSTILAVDSEFDCILTIDPGLSIVPGMILWTDPDGEWQFIAEYDPETGRCVLCKPFLASGIVGTSVYTWAMIHRVKMVSFTEPIPVEFFRSPSRARQGFDFDLPFAGVTAVRGYLETRLKRRSSIILKLYGSAPVRTLGTTQYVFNYPSCPTGETSNAFDPVLVDMRQSFEHTYVQKNRVTDTLQAPRSVASIAKSVFLYGGTITITGSPAEGDEIYISIGNPPTEEVFLRVPRYLVPAAYAGNAPSLAQALTVWMNLCEQFAAFYLAEADLLGGNYIRITDLRGVGGTISVESVSSDTMVVSAAGIDSGLGVLIGRRYAMSFANTASMGGYQSDLGPVSKSSGPTGGATRIELSDLSVSSPSTGASLLRIYALPDGVESASNLLSNTELRAQSVGSGGITAEPLDYGGTITIGGAPLAGDEVLVQIGSTFSETFTVAGGSTSPAEVAQGIAAWLETFGSFTANYTAVAEGEEVRITPIPTSYASTDEYITAFSTTSGTGMTVETEGILPLLEINTGRSYAISLVKTVSGEEVHESALVELGDLTGPVSTARRVLISGIPSPSSLEGADRLRLYASRDGLTSPYVLIADIALGTGSLTDLFTEADLTSSTAETFAGASLNWRLVAELALGEASYSDILTETELALQPSYSGPRQPSSVGPVLVTVKKDGYPWFYLSIPYNQVKSNVIDGRALRNVAQGTTITADINNQAEECDIQLVIQ